MISSKCLPVCISVSSQDINDHHSYTYLIFHTTEKFYGVGPYHLQRLVSLDILFLTGPRFFPLSRESYFVEIGNFLVPHYHHSVHPYIQS